MVNEAEFQARLAAKKAAKAAKAAEAAGGESKKKQRSEERKKKRKGDAEDSKAQASAVAAVEASGSWEASSGSWEAASGDASGLEDQTISCVDCGNDFLFSVAEQQFFLSKGYVSGKSRCKECTRAKKARFGEATDAAARREASTTCLACGKVGHSSKNCTIKPLSCFNCGGTGHKSKDCPKPRDASQACFKFQQTGACPRGDSCRFAHVAG
eukprot:Transcript_18621.p2 GENE.Transcript_18621~~Transcript_18621.p2  ORF type:complete len:212 (+),score=74.82 Transcript_18621:72-707(+)